MGREVKKKEERWDQRMGDPEVSACQREELNRGSDMPSVHVAPVSPPPSVRKTAINPVLHMGKLRLQKAWLKGTQLGHHKWDLDPGTAGPALQHLASLSCLPCQLPTGLSRAPRWQRPEGHICSQPTPGPPQERGLRGCSEGLARLHLAVPTAGLRPAGQVTSDGPPAASTAFRLPSAFSHR